MRLDLNLPRKSELTRFTEVRESRSLSNRNWPDYTFWLTYGGENSLTGLSCCLFLSHMIKKIQKSETPHSDRVMRSIIESCPLAEQATRRHTEHRMHLTDVYTACSLFFSLEFQNVSEGRGLGLWLKARARRDYGERKSARGKHRPAPNSLSSIPFFCACPVSHMKPLVQM